MQKAGINLIEGSDLFYKVTMGSSTYNFDLNMNYFAKSISFDYDLGVSKSGTIYMSEEALESATNLYNYFSGGYKELKNETSVWISKQLFNDLKSGKSIEIGLGNNTKEIFKFVRYETFSFGEKTDKTAYQIPVFIVRSETSKKEIWIANDPKNRLIVMMDLDFRIDLINFMPYDE
jgi:hypothetical protein